MLHRRVAAVVIALLWATWGMPSYAQDQPSQARERRFLARRAQLEIEPCVGVPRLLLASLIEGELHASVVDSDQEATWSLKVGCASQAWRLSVNHLITGHHVTRTMLVEGAQPIERARVLVLALAELVELSAMVLEPPRPEPASLSWALMPLRPSPLPAPARWQLELGAGSGRWLNQEHVQLGALVGLRYRVSPRRHGLWGQLELSRAQAPSAQGDLERLLYSGSLGWSAQWWPHASWGLDLGVGVRAGGVQFKPTRSEEGLVAQTQQLPFAGPLGRAQLIWAPLRPPLYTSPESWGVLLQPELGWALLGAEATADGQPVSSVTGAWASLSLGVSRRF